MAVLNGSNSIELPGLEIKEGGVRDTPGVLVFDPRQTPFELDIEGALKLAELLANYLGYDLVARARDGRVVEETEVPGV